MRPQPSPAERRVLLVALAELHVPRPAAYESEWRRSGIALEDGSATWPRPAPPTGRGATRT